jgi:hypothetical protein
VHPAFQVTWPALPTEIGLKPTTPSRRPALQRKGMLA